MFLNKPYFRLKQRFFHPHRKLIRQIKKDFPTGCTLVVYTKKIIPEEFKDNEELANIMSIPIITGEKIEHRTDGQYIYRVESDINN